MILNKGIRYEERGPAVSKTPDESALPERSGHFASLTTASNL